MTVSGNMNVQIDGGSPWGFRLQGGGNFPLQVIKIRKRSKSYRHLIEGDIIIRVNGIPVQGKTHEAVMDMVDATAGLLNLEIFRGEALHKIPKKAPVPAPVAAVASASQASNRAATIHTTEHSMHQHTSEESMHQKKISSQQMSSQQISSQQTSHSVLQEQHHQQHQQQQQVTKSNIVLQNKVHQQKATQRQLSSGWQESNSQQQMTQHQQQVSVQQQQNALQHQQMMADQQRLAQQQFAEQQMIREQLAQQRQMAAQQQHTVSEQQSVQSMSSVQQTESHHEEQSSSVSTAMWTSAQTTNEIQTDLAQHAITSIPKPYKPKVASHLPLREFTPVKPSPPPASPVPVAPTPPPKPIVHLYDKENVAPSPIPKPATPVNVPQFNVKNVKNLVNQDWNEVELDELDLPIPDYSKRMVITPSSPKEVSPPPAKKTIVIPDMTIKPAPPVAPKPKRVLAEVQPEEAEPWIPDSDIVPIQLPDRPHLPIFGPPVVYGLNPALAPQRSNSMEQEESIVSETSSGSRRNDPNYEAKKQKIYSDSSFYYDPKGVYPTIEEQIDLCKKISNSLTAAANSRARGATMFAKRQKRSAKWIHAGFSEGMVADLEDLYSELDASEGGTKPLFQFRIPNLASQVSVETPNMSLSREEYENLKAQPKVDHKVLNPNAMSILSDLQNSKGRGAKLFAKRQARCEKWVIDEKSTSASAPVTPSEPPPVSIVSSTEMMNVQNRLADMIQKPMPIIQPTAQPPKPAPKPQVFQPQVFQPQVPQPQAPQPQVLQPQVINKHIGVALPTVNADLKAEFKIAFDGPNFNRKAKGWNSGPVEPPTRSKRAQSVQPSTKGPPPPVPPKPGKRMKSNPRPALWSGNENLPVHDRSSSDRLRVMSPGNTYHDASGYSSDVDHRTKAYSFKKSGVFRPSQNSAAVPWTSQPLHFSLPGSDM